MKFQAIKSLEYLHPQMDVVFSLCNSLMLSYGIKCICIEEQAVVKENNATLCVCVCGGGCGHLCSSKVESEERNTHHTPEH